MNEPYLIEGAVPQSLANLIRESKGESATTKYLPAQFYSELRTIIQSGHYAIKSASGAVASFNDSIAAPLVGLRVALPYDAEGYQSVSVTVNGTATTITLPTTIYGGYLDVVTGQLVATHDADGNLLTNQKLYFLPPVNIDALAGANTVRSDAGDVTVSYKVDYIDNPVAAENDVIFIDYDGTIRYSYSAAEFADLTEPPPNPTHKGLTAQGWNWELPDAQEYVAQYGMIEIGQNYVTDDGKTRLYITLPEGFLEPVLGVALDNGRQAVIDWGDGSTDTITGAGLSANTLVHTPHIYTTPGSYIISIANEATLFIGPPSSECVLLWSGISSSYKNKIYLDSLYQVELGNQCQIASYAFIGASDLSTITIAADTQLSGYRTFRNAASLQALVLPKANPITGFNYGDFCNTARLLKYVSMPKGTRGLYSSEFYACLSLLRLSIPVGATLLSLDFLRGTYGLSRVSIPEGVTAFRRYTFSNTSLKDVKLPSTLTDLSSDGGSTFASCDQLLRITIPQNVATIGASAFSGCISLSEIRFKPTTPPTVSNVNAWTRIPTACVIYVPRGTLSAYISSTNYPDPTVYTYVEEDE